MLSTTLIDILFKGTIDRIAPAFINEYISGCKDWWWNEPKMDSKKEIVDVVAVFENNLYVDLAISTDNFCILNHSVPHVFINFTRKEDAVELLFFLDLMNIGGGSVRDKIDNIEKWVIEFRTRYQFDEVVCQLDNGDKLADSNTECQQS
ncbi:hypothetical protein [Chitinophaga flava]|uniref:Uncharacterized protein n=1 Tax=Chitinophaga flava TaxID=2259036 RepID=A0A365Y0Y4_9BACT|nr:hypothetical protein [Chitinophaga flava]RBL92257.1 hypothetical protein DF182_06590 [Chitinophaga flava]